MDVSCIIVVLNFHRSVVTAGHCLCGVSKRTNHAEMECQKDSNNVQLNDVVLNQVTPENVIHVHTGKKDRSAMLESEKIVMAKAYVMLNGGTRNIDYDVGLITSPMKLGSRKRVHGKVSRKLVPTTFYSKPTSTVAPICLGAESKELHECHITTVGWGKLYTEDPPEKSSSMNNEFTTCTTNGVGPKTYRYQICNLALIELNEWQCPKTHPPSYDSIAEECSKLIKNIDDEIAGRTKNLKLHQEDWRRLNEVQIYEFIETDTDEPTTIKKKLECYRTDLFKNGGWCEVKGSSSSAEWGFCDTSCKHVKVLFIDIC